MEEVCKSSIVIYFERFQWKSLSSSKSDYSIFFHFSQFMLKWCLWRKKVCVHQCRNEIRIFEMISYLFIDISCLHVNVNCEYWLYHARDLYMLVYRSLIMQLLTKTFRVYKIKFNKMDERIWHIDSFYCHLMYLKHCKQYWSKFSLSS